MRSDSYREDLEDIFSRGEWVQVLTGIV